MSQVASWALKAFKGLKASCLVGLIWEAVWGACGTVLVREAVLPALVHLLHGRSCLRGLETPKEGLGFRV